VTREEKLARMDELRAEFNQLKAEVQADIESEFTPEVLQSFWDRYKLMSVDDIQRIISPGHPCYEAQFQLLLGYVMRNRLFGFAPANHTRQIPVPVDDAMGNAPVINYEERHREALRIRDELITKDAERRRSTEVPLRSEPVAPRIAPILNEIAAATADFDSRHQEALRLSEAAKLNDDQRIAAEEARKRSFASAQPTLQSEQLPTLDQEQQRIAVETADVQSRQAEAKRLADEAAKAISRL
jgi:hypothetical protein